jgi:hypothetical protein
MESQGQGQIGLQLSMDLFGSGGTSQGPSPLVEQVKILHAAALTSHLIGVKNVHAEIFARLCAYL